MDHAQAQHLFDLALAHQRANDHPHAIPLYRQILTHHPNNPDAWNNLGIALKITGDLDPAADAFRHAIALLPTRAQTYASLGHTLRDAGQLDEAIAAYRQGLERAPDPRTADSLLLALHAHPAYGRAALFHEHQLWYRRFAQPLTQSQYFHPPTRPPKNRLKIGYVAADLGNHPLGRFLLPLLENHDHARFEIVLYNDHARPDPVSARLRAAANVWRETGSLSHPQLAQLVHADAIDILVDLTSHAPGSRLLAFAQKPAPVQATYLAYCSTTGLPTIDYRLTDPHLDPPGIDESLYSEKSLRLPYTYWCYPPPPDAPDIADLPALATGHLTFGALNSFSKTTPQILSLWAQILATLPNSRLLLHAHPGSHRARAASLFAQHNVDPARLEFIPFLPTDQYFATYNRIDIALDTYPWAGGITTCDALYMGLPVITLPGETATSRGGLSILSNLNLTEFAAHSPAHYLHLATTQSPARLHPLRQSLRARLQSSPLMSPHSFTQQVESAYQSMWTH